MEITNSFEVERPVEETYQILTDLEFIAPCFPGAQLTEIEGEEYRGVVKIKVGPISAKYKGKAVFVEQNNDEHRAQLKAEGRDPRQGNANALVTATMVGKGDDLTEVTVHTDLSISGKIASFGRGAIEDISSKILLQFVDNLRDKLAQTGEEAAEAAAPTPEAASGVRRIDAPEAEPVDLLAVSGDTIAKRLAPVVAVVVLLFILRWLRNRG